MRYLPLFFALASAGPVLAQPSVDQILEKYTQAIGGQAAYEKVTTRVMKGEVRIPDDDTRGTLEVFAKAPDRYHNKLNFPDGLFETVLDGDHGWEKNPDSGVHAMSRAD